MYGAIVLSMIIMNVKSFLRNQIYHNSKFKKIYTNSTTAAALDGNVDKLLQTLIFKVQTTLPPPSKKGT